MPYSGRINNIRKQRAQSLNEYHLNCNKIKRGYCLSITRERLCSSTVTPCAIAAGTQQLVSAPVRFIDEQYVGSVKVCEIEGKGRGVITTADVAPGELLLRCHPLGVVTGPQQVRLTVENLQVHLASNYNANTHHWLQQLYDGSDSSITAAIALQQHQQQEQHQQKQPQQQLLQLNSHHSSSQGCSSSDDYCGAPDSSVPAVTDAVLQRLMDVVRYNAYGDLHDDLAAAAAAGEEAVALIGLWPEFSMLNHSCVPNAINWVLPGVNRAMAVRAATHIPAGEEVTISYLGAPQLLPLDGRREALAAAFGFHCSCPRCLAEEDIPNSLAELMQDIGSRVHQSFAPRLKRCLASAEDHDFQQLLDMRRQATAMMTAMFQQFRKHLIHPTVRQQLLSSCFRCLEIIADIDAALGDQPAVAASLAKCLAAVEAVTPGSDLHVILASKYEVVQQRVHGHGSSEAAAAWQRCLQAHMLRYGQDANAQLVRELAGFNLSMYV